MAEAPWPLNLESLPIGPIDWFPAGLESSFGPLFPEPERGRQAAPRARTRSASPARRFPARMGEFEVLRRESQGEPWALGHPRRGSPGLSAASATRSVLAPTHWSFWNQSPDWLQENLQGTLPGKPHGNQEGFNLREKVPGKASGKKPQGTLHGN